MKISIHISGFYILVMLCHFHYKDFFEYLSLFPQKWEKRTVPFSHFFILVFLVAIFLVVRSLFLGSLLFCCSCCLVLLKFRFCLIGSSIPNLCCSCLIGLSIYLLLIHLLFHFHWRHLFQILLQILVVLFRVHFLIYFLDCFLNFKD